MSVRREYTNEFPAPQLPERRGNFVEPAPPVRRPATVDAVPQWAAPASRDQVPAAWDPQSGTVEKTSAMDRAQAVRVRLVPYLWSWAGVGLVVGGVAWLMARQAPIAALLGALSFAALTGWSYYRLNRTDYDYSREGTEQLRIRTAAEIEELRMLHEQELRRAALDAYLRHLEGRDR